MAATPTPDARLSAGQRASDGAGPATPAPKVTMRGIELRYASRRGEHLAVTDVDLDLADGEFLVIVGPSGCGKSTLLKLVAGLLAPTDGEVALDGRPVDGSVPAGVGMVFQNDALLPWRTVLDNVRLPLALGRGPKEEQLARTRQLLEQVGLARFEDYYPRQLSGGMRKRVALARTLAYDPAVFLMDEPFGPLDAQTRIRLGGEFLALWEQVGKSVMFVTHDVEEAVAMADRVVVMTAAPGRIKASFDVDLPRPRDFYEIRFDPRFEELHREIWHSLATEHGADE